MLLSGLAACDGLALKEKAFDFISPDNFYKTEKDADASCIGIYGAVDKLEIFHLLNGLGSVGLTRNGNYSHHNSGGLNEYDDIMRRVWQFLFEAIRKANTTIYYLEQSAIQNDIKNRYIAEARAIRAYSYFRAVRLWGDVPMRLSPVVESSDFPLTPMKEVYEQIIKDLEEAIPILWNKAEKPPGRMNKTAAQVLLADVYITMASSAKSYNSATSARGLKPYHDAFSSRIDEFYAKAKELCKEVIESPFVLLNDWTHMWGRGPGFDYRKNDEFIWASQTAPGLYGHDFGNHYSPIYSSYTPASNTQFLGVTFEFVVSFDPNDLRYKEGLIWEYVDVEQSVTRNQVVIQRWRRHVNDKNYPASTSGSVVIFRNADTLIYENRYWEMAPKKFFDMQYTVAGVGTAVAMPYYRMAEAYLMYAEAESALNGVTQDAVNKINAVRQRVNMPLYTEGQFSPEEFRERILDELLWEFALEGKDYFHLLRMGRLEERCYGVQVNRFGKDNVPNPRPRSADHYWLPYPFMEKSLNKHLVNKTRMSYE